MGCFARVKEGSAPLLRRERYTVYLTIPISDPLGTKQVLCAASPSLFVGA